jgi:hypothetical protein
VLAYQKKEHWYDTLERLEMQAEHLHLGPRKEPRRPSRRVARSNAAGEWAVEALDSLRRWFVYGSELHYVLVVDQAARALREAAGERDWKNARRTLDELLREIAVAALLPPRTVESRWLTWNGGTVRCIAQAIYEDHRFEEMPILADALEDAGCADAALLMHCRGAAPHARGCWVLDLLLGMNDRS